MAIGVMRFLLFLVLMAALDARPNVIVIITDDQGYGDLSAHGNPHLKTPHLDLLRSESTAFDRFLVSPTCSPTRSALLTGRHEFAVGVSHTILGRSLLRPGVPTLPEVMRDAGYATAIFGKWHLGDAYPCRPEDRGFDEVFVHGSGGIGQAADYWGNGYFDPMIRRKSGWVETSGYCTDVFFKEATTWMERQVESRKPFFLWLGTNAPHDPFIPPSGGDEPFLKAGLKKPVASFYAMIENIDSNVGAMMERVERLGIEEDTIVVFLTDNGSSVAHWNAGMRGKKGSPDEGGVRVPCFVRWLDRVESGRVVGTPAAHVDLMPTLAGLCGAKLPDEWKGDGVDLSRSLLGEREFPTGRSHFAHVGRWPGDESPERHRANQFSVRTDRWRLVGLELFDMATDDGQTTDVFPGPDGVGNRLLVDYGRWWDSVLPSLRRPVRYVIGDEKVPLIEVCVHDWWPSLEADAGGNFNLWNQATIRNYLERASVAGTRNKLPEACGHWKLEAAKDGRYRVWMSLLPKTAPDDLRRRIGVLRTGTAHVRVGKREVQAEVLQGASSVALEIDLQAGPIDLEAWFGGQLPAGRKLGAIYASIERIGDRRDFIPEVRVEPGEEPESGDPDS